MSLSALGFSPAETYAIEVEGDVLAHVTQLVADGEPLCGCLLCRRYTRAIATARYVGQAEEQRP